MMMMIVVVVVVVVVAAAAAAVVVVVIVVILNHRLRGPSEKSSIVCQKPVLAATGHALTALNCITKWDLQRRKFSNEMLCSPSQHSACENQQIVCQDNVGQFNSKVRRCTAIDALVVRDQILKRSLD